jgi:hypothetical protein
VKIFISHSSHDKWIARRISQDLEALGVTTFLDEKDIETGDSIDDSIQEHLKECDEIVMLLSPSALDSHWVLLEIGGARVLGMRLVPILLHVGANDLPAPLSKGLARNLNEIEKYYEEVKRREEGDLVEPPRPRVRRRSRGPTIARPRRDYAEGDLVRIPDRPRSPFVTDEDIPIEWLDEMDAFIGNVATVTVVDDDRTVKLDVDGEAWWWAMDWLEPAE